MWAVVIGHVVLIAGIVGAPIMWPEIAFLYGPAIVASIVFRDVCAARYLRSSANPATERFKEELVAIVVPVRNEDTQILARVVDALVAQHHRNWEAFFVDDASVTSDAHELLLRRAATDSRIRALRLPERRGKRRAQAEAIRRSSAPFIVTLDSDTVLDPGALDHVLQPFENVQVMAVMGNIAGLNRDSNVLTRISASRARHGVLGFWAMQSYFGAILCIWGAFSAYRREVIADNLDRYVEQRFAGRPVDAGDDRRLTFFALQRGRVVLARNALAETLMPGRARNWLLQQIRWSREYLRFGLRDATRHGLRHPAIWLSFPDIVVWLCIPGLCAGLVANPAAAFAYFVPYYGWLGLSAVAWDDADSPARYPLWLIAGPILTLASGIVRFLVRLAALTTLTGPGWGTR